MISFKPLVHVGELFCVLTEFHPCLHPLPYIFQHPYGCFYPCDQLMSQILHFLCRTLSFFSFFLNHASPLPVFLIWVKAVLLMCPLFCFPLFCCPALLQSSLEFYLHQSGSFLTYFLVTSPSSLIHL